MITDSKKWYFLASFIRENNIERSGSIYLEYEIHSKDTDMSVKIMTIVRPAKTKHNFGDKSMKLSLVIFDHTESLLEKKGACFKNLEKVAVTEITKHCIWLFIIYTLFI